MAYTKNPQLPLVRMEAVNMVLYQGWSSRKAARHFGFSHGAILNWLKRKPERGYYGRFLIPTLSSKPHSNPKALPGELVSRILELRQERKQCAEILHHRLLREGCNLSLSSVKRVLRRNNCSRYSKWKKWHQYPERPLAEKPGVLVEIDTILEGIPGNRLCAYTLLDVCSRWAYAWPTERISTYKSLRFVKEAQNMSPFRFGTLQSDHGSEFSKYFTKQIMSKGFNHRHSRVRTPSDNGHLERFNRTLQDECLRQIPRKLSVWKKEIPEYLCYYNNERFHMGINMKTPIEVVRSY